MWNEFFPMTISTTAIAVWHVVVDMACCSSLAPQARLVAAAHFCVTMLAFVTGYTGFESVRNTLGDGIRIAHLDTGYWPEHISTPKNIKPDLGWDFWDWKLSTVDPGTDWILDMPGHGTATLGLLSGNEMHLIYLGKTFDGYLGGAPNADVVPVRIGPSVIHLFTRTMAQGIDFALATGWDPKNRCDVASISHGGLPSVFWADAVNNVYDAGIVVVAASGDNYNLIFDFPFHDTVWPSRFNRVITAVGATYDQAPYVTDDITAMQGNWSPESVMKKAIAGYTPNVPWMLFQTQNQYDMDGAGTSSSTPQIAAACALWLQLYGKQFPENWKRIEACRLALFGSAQSVDPSLEKYLGRGLLNVPSMLDAARAQSVEQAVQSGNVQPTPPDDVTSAIWQTITQGVAATNKEKMYEVEAAQIIHRSTNRDLLVCVREVERTAQPGKDVLRRLKVLLKNEPDISSALHAQIST
jgi:hypothetical protein